MFVKYIELKDGSYTTLRYCRNESDFVPSVGDYVAPWGLKVISREWFVNDDVLEITLSK
jgi:hypothetical protein